MKVVEKVSELLVDYILALWQILVSPASYFACAKPLGDLKSQFFFVLPLTFFSALSAALVSGKLWYLPIYLLAEYLAIGLWVFTLRLVLRLFGERHSVEQLAHIASCSSVAFLLAGLPYVGLALFVMWAFFLNFLGLVHFLKVNKGAALAVLALPVIVLGMGGAILSFILLWLASLTTLFNH